MNSIKSFKEYTVIIDGCEIMVHINKNGKLIRAYGYASDFTWKTPNKDNPVFTDLSSYYIRQNKIEIEAQIEEENENNY